MKKISRYILVAFLLMPLTASAHTAQKEDLQIIHPWVEPALEEQETTAHMTFMNTAKQRSYVITGASSPVAETLVFVRAEKGKDGEIVPVKRLSLASGDIVDESVILVRFMNLNRDLSEGEVVDMTLHFQDKTKLPLRLGVGKMTMPE